jgi:predicted site-specific integrase-resolvase
MVGGSIVKRYTTADVAAALGIEAVTVRVYNARGQMPAPSGHVGRTPYWTAARIEPWISGQRARRAMTDDTPAGVD